MADQNNTDKGRILIVDDTPDNLRLLSRMLTRRGYDISTAKSGMLALEMAAATPPDLVLLDVYMPIMDGYEVCRSLKADENLAAIPVVFLSALSEPVDKLRGFEAGGVDYVTKPFHFHEVIARVENHLELYRNRIENERLRAQERAYFDQILHLKDELIYTATHDLKNPLTSIKLSISLLKRLIKSDNEKVNRHLDRISEDSERMLALISEVLDLARVDAQMDVDADLVLIHPFIQKQIGLIQEEVEQAGIVIHVESVDEALSARFDPESLARVFQALLHQLIKRSEAESGVSISVAYAVEDGFVGIDIGGGDTLNDREDGVDDNRQGVWFAFMQAIVEHHNGRLEVGQTHAFKLSLPCE